MGLAVLDQHHLWHVDGVPARRRRRRDDDEQGWPNHPARGAEEADPRERVRQPDLQRARWHAQQAAAQGLRRGVEPRLDAVGTLTRLLVSTRLVTQRNRLPYRRTFPAT